MVSKEDKRKKDKAKNAPEAMKHVNRNRFSVLEVSEVECIDQVEESGHWEKISITLDSGAMETVGPRNLAEKVRLTSAADLAGDLD